LPAPGLVAAHYLDGGRGGADRGRPVAVHPCDVVPVGIVDQPVSQHRRAGMKANVPID